MDIDAVFDMPKFTPTGSRYIGQEFTSRVTPFGWYGGKYYHLDFLRPLFPLDAVTFCDVFGGSGAVILNVGNYPSKIYNDVDSEVVNFFRVLKNPKTRETLIREIALTPYSREEFNNAQNVGNISKVEQARRFYIRAQQARNSIVQTRATWSFSVADIPHGINKWTNSTPRLQHVAQRFQAIQIEQVTALEILEKYDAPETLFYLDPPYVLSTRNAPNMYGYEMTDKDHIHLSEVLQTLQGRAVLSGYRSDLYDRLYKDWNRIDAPSKVAYASPTRDVRQECVWKNF